jgi:hypothetical protein
MDNPAEPWRRAAREWEASRCAPGLHVAAVVLLLSDGTSLPVPIPSPDPTTTPKPNELPREEAPAGLRGLAARVWLAASTTEPRNRKRLLRVAGGKANSHGYGVIAQLVEEGFLHAEGEGFVRA